MTENDAERQTRMGRRGFLSLVGALGAAAALGTLGASKCATYASLALRNARLFAAVDGTVADDMTVAMAGDRIVAIGADADVVLGRDTTIIDCAGAFVMPGLIDTHTHVTITLLRREPLFGQWLRAGLTTVRDTGTLKAGPGVIRDIARELAPVPRIIAAGPIVTVPGGYPATRPEIGDPISYYITGAAEAAAGVNAILDAGADFIKIAVETGVPGGGLLEDGDGPTLSVDEIAAIVAAAHARGAGVSAHVSNAFELQRALAGGVDSIAHTPLDEISSRTLDDMAARGVTMSSTLNIWGNTPLRAAQRNIERFVQRGGVVGMGTDVPFQAFEGLPHGELQMLSDAGLTNAQVLLAATRDAAVVCRRPDLGTIAEGNIADIIVVQGDPLRDLGALASVSHVVQAGAVVR